MRMTAIPALVLSAAMLLGGCESVGSVFESDEIPIENRSALEIFDDAEQLLAEGTPARAAQTFDEVERLYPFSQLAKRATIMSAFSYYEAAEYAQARSSANRFIELYPSDPDAAYAQYLIALTYYDNIVDVGRDQALTRNALNALTEVVRRYPNTDYARDSRFKIDLTNNHLAGKEMEVGRYYLKRGHYTSAINRFGVVIARYQTTSQTPEALHRLVECYLSIGLDKEAQTVAAVLGENFVGSEWYAASYALLEGEDLRPARANDGLFRRIYRQVIRGDWL